MQKFILADQTKQEIYRILLCNVYYLLDSLAYGEVFNGEYLEAGLYDVMPPRLYRQLDRLKEAYPVPPDVIACVRYYEVGSAKWAFYCSGQKDDYLGYIDKGVQSTKVLDYLDYTGNKEKRFGRIRRERLTIQIRQKGFA